MYQLLRPTSHSHEQGVVVVAVPVLMVNVVTRVVVTVAVDVGQPLPEFAQHHVDFSGVHNIRSFHFAKPTLQS